MHASCMNMHGLGCGVGALILADHARVLPRALRICTVADSVRDHWLGSKLARRQENTCCSVRIKEGGPDMQPRTHSGLWGEGLSRLLLSLFCHEGGGGKS